ncbi:hypothetical protein PLESTM_001914800 [Pleodorina starrii]|nr:hypothetical protein PLESTM_001914800 [Pleodorina starrii]
MTMVVDTVDGAAQPGGSTQSPADAARAAALAIRQKEVQEAMRNDTHKKVEAVSVDVCLKSPLAALGKDKVAATVVELAAAESINPPTSVEEVLAHGPRLGLGRVELDHVDAYGLDLLVSVVPHRLLNFFLSDGQSCSPGRVGR